MIEKLSCVLTVKDKESMEAVGTLAQKINEIIDEVNSLDSANSEIFAKIHERMGELRYALREQEGNNVLLQTLRDNRRCDKCYYERERSMCGKCSGYDHYLLKMEMRGQ